MDTALSVEGLRVWRPGSRTHGSQRSRQDNPDRGHLGSVANEGGQVRTIRPGRSWGQPWEVVRKGLVVVAQDRYLFTDMSVEGNLELASKRAGKHDGHSFTAEDLYELFPRMGERKVQYAGTLSGGERSMLAIARGLALQPRVLILDEPSLGLAPIIVDLIMSTIERIAEAGPPILLVEQNINQTLAMSSGGYVLESCEVTASDTGEALLGSDAILSGYLAVDVESVEGGS